MRLKVKVVLLILVSVLCVPFFQGHGSAASGSIYASPSNGSVQIGNNIVIELRINPGTDVNAVQATLSYDPSALQFLSSVAQAPFTCVQNSGGGGSVNVSCALLGSTTNVDTLITSIVFKSLVGSGSTSVNVQSANAANNGVWTNPTTANAHITLTTPPVSAASNTPNQNTPEASKSTPNKTTIIKSSDTPLRLGSTADITAVIPVTITVKPHNVAYTTLSFDVTTSRAVQTWIQYGEEKNNLHLSTSPSNAATISTISLDTATITPGTTYYYQAITKDANGFQTTTPVQSVVTKGYTLQVTMLDSAYRPIANQTVTLHSTPTSVKTNKAGIATFTGVAPGLHHVDYISSTKHTYEHTVYVANSFKVVGSTETAAAQREAVVLVDYAQPKHFPWSLLFLVLILLVAATMFLTRRSHIFRRKYAFAKTLSSRYSIAQISKMEQYIHSTPSYDDDIKHLTKSKLGVVKKSKVIAK